MLLDTCFLIDIMRESKKNIEGPAIRKLQSIEAITISIFHLRLFLQTQLWT